MDGETSSALAGQLPARASDYAHARHSGNVGDVFKHVALAATLTAFETPPALYAESHAGDGLFALGSVGEWTAGLQKVWAPTNSQTGSSKPFTATERWLDTVRALSPVGAAKPEKLPGSPLVAQSLLPASTRLVLHELDPQASAVLQRVFKARGANNAQVLEADGFAGLPAVLAGAKVASAVALIDPPYTQKGEWSQAAECLAKCAEAAPEAALLLWYPIKALTRPRGLLAELVKLGVHGTVIELITTPLRLKRDKLAGSGMICVHPPAGAVESLLSELPRLGTAMMTHGEWSGAQIGF